MFSIDSSSGNRVGEDFYDLANHLFEEQNITSLIQTSSGKIWLESGPWVLFFRLPARQRSDQGEAVIFLKDRFHCGAFAIDEDKTDFPVPDFQALEDLGD